MKTTIDSAGRIVIPRALRDRAGLRSGMTIELELREGVIELRPAEAEVRLVQSGRWLVAQSTEDGEPLTLEQVNAVTREVRERF